MKKIGLFILAVILIKPMPVFSQAIEGREHLSMDLDWRFAFGHPYDTKKDFNNGSGYFSYFTKAGYGDGAAAANFDDRSFRPNDEANLNIYDAAFAAEQVKVFEEDKGKSRLMTRAEFKNRSAVGKMFDEIAGALRRQLWKLQNQGG